MAFDEVLAGRIRTLLVDRDDVTEKRMFGSLAFLVAGHMTVTVSGNDGVMVRIDPASDEPWLATAQPMVMRGRELAGWRTLPSTAVADDALLAAVVAHGVRFVSDLPAK